MRFSVRQATQADIPLLVAVFREAVARTNSRDYFSPQIKVWLGRGNAVRFKELFAQDLAFFVAESDGACAGFISISQSGYLHSLFMHPDFERKGIASALFRTAMDFAKGCGARAITTDASITALPFFTRMGLCVTEEKQAVLNGMALKNFGMRTSLMS